MSLAMRPPTLPHLKPMCINVTQHQPTKSNNNLSMSELATRLEKLINRNDHINLPSSSTSSSTLSSRFEVRPEKLRKRWKDYQGYKNWEGMLDPLDENLRAEILRYGHFVEAAYTSFDFDPSSPSYASCRYPKNKLFDACGLPNTGYKVTKHLRTTSGIQLPKMALPNWVATKTSYVGYVAVCDNKDEIKRLGRRDVVIAFRGTTTCLEWLENLRATLTHLSEERGAMVESGFLSLYTSATASCVSLQEMVREEIRRIIETYGDDDDEPLSFTVTGHSLGAALATLTAYDIRKMFDRMVTVISFGGPRVGNRRFRERVERQGTKVLRIVNSDDVITKMPGFVFDDEEGGERGGGGAGDDVEEDGDVHVAGVPSWIQKRVEDAQWVYAEVGKELRLCSRDSPYLSGFNVATCHELNTYLHLVDGFVSSTCPFRATAKRFLRR